ncbi:MULTISPECIES: [FeFe] hydrogenase H-cluster radical SAM maturase HydG [Clostridium]|uniref:[FeFe] hydrogenase H-cluster radical SAM maturase HydG n=1 Tax=Clostridium TaxID=1485 RepID=UPI000BE28357|nr:MULTISPECIES: [FeFe] hydrogenase H-cluster radical SAM maturase HydG [Clostridium]MDB1968593.1 [FeFe] hydrogenase H-cluster radical SAM maturase HydG [Clostridium tertium]MDU3526090.1 [FeFe] hydrogenase H-cluster radical SAM maturase HydG [Clostridium sp.]MDU3548115.1 [FeFe] hydrogenase H-cluster radical SAM maturase HydG [Clostridium sp.]MDU6364733.1 [FeFe] hydrogenase H-cluster radical SAM maturase HydG [Clostridium sp.]MDU7364602.1 [FeFe] hydrogenase H-cluster radical SAM maturase HydG [
MFIDHEYIERILEEAKGATSKDIKAVLEKAKKRDGLSYEDIAVLLQVEDKEDLKEIYKLAGEIKDSIYGKRVVIFAPLYVSDYCVNNCVYCGYKRSNSFGRRKLSMPEVAEEVRILEKMGHKRLALELGEDPVNAPIDYVLECLDTIYKTQNDNGEIRRVNVNIAATTVEEYKRLKEAKIGTYILFQETYYKPSYDKMHPKSLKGDYNYHLTAFDRAMEAGIDDVGAGVLFGLSDPKFEVIGLMMHNRHLEEKYGVGFHTISMPRLKPASGVTLQEFPNLVDDEMFKKLVAIIRIAVPFTGIIMSTRETAEMRRELLRYGVSQISAGSSTGVGGYKEREEGKEALQFKTSDDRTPLEVIKSVLDDGYIPSYCTACYRRGRTGERFMKLAKSGEIQNVCEPNAMTTLLEFAIDYGDKEILEKAETVIKTERERIKRDDIKELLDKNLERLRAGERDLYL